MIQLHHGDCLDVMPTIEAGSIDMVLADPPYGTTACKWDSVIPLSPLWRSLDRIAKERTAIVMTACQPFTTTLIQSQQALFKYCWVWEKTTPSGHLNAKHRPLRAHEDICVFVNGGKPTYNPQKTSGHTRKTATRTDVSEVYGKQKESSYDSTERYPRSVIKTSTDTQKSKLHPTQKPLALMEYLIKTYTNEGDTVLDFAMGSGTTGVACQNLNRSFIGIELDADYFEIAKQRLNIKEPS